MVIGATSVDLYTTSLIIEMENLVNTIIDIACFLKGPALNVIQSEL